VFKIAQAKAIKAEFVKKAEREATEGSKAADLHADGAIVGVGLINRDKGAGTDTKSKEP
jgi:NADH dehydrogenase (ubiquinone) Fe-S protein 5